MDIARKLIDLADQRSTQLSAAEAALEAGKHDEYNAAMGAITAIDGQIDDLKALQDAQGKKPAAPAVVHKRTEAEDLANARMEALRRGDSVTFETNEVAAAFGVQRMTDAFTLASGSIVEPTRAGTTIRDRLAPVSSIIDMVSVIDLTGCGAIEESYVVSELEAKAGTVAATAGTTRTDSTPAFAKAKISPYNVDVTSYVDRNIARLSPVAYMDKIQSMALKALRKTVASLIYSGDGQSTPTMFGLKNAANTDGDALYSTEAVTANGMTVDTLMSLYYAYGGDDELGGNAVLCLNKRDLRTIGEFRGTNEKQRIFNVEPNEQNTNTGIIRDGGFVVPYVLSSGLTPVTGTAASASAAIQTMIYANPLAYELGLFGGYTIRLDESVKAVEREIAILGDVMVGGNLVVDKCCVIATIDKTGG